MASGERWYFTLDQIHNTPSRKSGYDYDKELSCRQQAANFIQDMGQRIQVNQLCINTAIVYMHRFYMFHSFSRFHRTSLASAALFLAAKVEEQPRKLEHVIRVAQICLHNRSHTSESYNEQAQDLIMNENILLQTLGFDVAIDHPHTHIVRCCQLVRAHKDLAQTSYFMASYSLHLTTMCLQYKPTVVAAFCIHLASKWSNWEILESSQGKPWFWYVDKTVTSDLLEQLTTEFLALFEKCPSRLKRKIMSLSHPHIPSTPSNNQQSSSQQSQSQTELDKRKENRKQQQVPQADTVGNQHSSSLSGSLPVSSGSVAPPSTSVTIVSSSSSAPSASLQSQPPPPVQAPLHQPPHYFHQRNQVPVGGSSSNSLVSSGGPTSVVPPPPSQSSHQQSTLEDKRRHMGDGGVVSCSLLSTSTSSNTRLYSPPPPATTVHSTNSVQHHPTSRRDVGSNQPGLSLSASGINKSSSCMFINNQQQQQPQVQAPQQSSVIASLPVSQSALTTGSLPSQSHQLHHPLVHKHPQPQPQPQQLPPFHQHPPLATNSLSLQTGSTSLSRPVSSGASMPPPGKLIPQRNGEPHSVVKKEPDDVDEKHTPLIPQITVPLRKSEANIVKTERSIFSPEEKWSPPQTSIKIESLSSPSQSLKQPLTDIKWENGSGSDEGETIKPNGDKSHKKKKKKHKEHKDKHKEKHKHKHKTKEPEPIVITIPKEKITISQPADGLKLKIAKEKIPNPTSGLKIKISKDKLKESKKRDREEDDSDHLTKHHRQNGTMLHQC